MRKITLIAFIVSFGIVSSLFSQTPHWIESFENPLDTWSGYTTGTINFQESGAWDFVSVYPESSTASWDGSKACRINDDIAGASITSPAVNTAGKISFYYHRPFSGSGTFELLVSLNGGVYTSLDVVDFSAVTSPTYYEYVLNDLSNNIRFRILNDNHTAHLTIDYVTITDFTGGNTPPIISNIGHTPSLDITSTTTVSVSADVTDSDGTVAGVELHWGTTSGSLGTTISMSNTGGNTYTTDSDIPAQADGTTVYYEVYALDDLADGTTSPEYSYIVKDPTTAVLDYLQEFNPDFGDMYFYSVLGVQGWEITGFGNPGPSAKMSGYSGGAQANEDWLITPSFDLTSLSGAVFTFDEAINYESAVAANMKVYISTDYFGLGDPYAAIWTELVVPNRSSGGSWSFVSTGTIDISTYVGNSNVHIGFKYLSNTTSAGTWEIDNVSVAVPLSYYNLQWPPSGTIESWWNYTVYAQCWESGLTDSPGQGAGIECWIGYSLVDEDPNGSANFTWVMANYDSDQGNNDQYSTNLGADVPMAPGTYYYVARWRFNNGPYTYGGFNSGAWDGTTNVSGVLTINASAAASTWTGAVDNNWFDAGNWDNGVPGYITDATIPAGLVNYPVIPSGTPMCGTLLVQSGATGSGSIVETSLNVVGSTTVERYLSADQYHTFSPSVGGELIDIFHLNAGEPDVYLYENNEATYDYTELYALGTPLNAYQGYMVWVDGANAGGVTGWTFSETGALNTGAFGAADNLVRTTTGFNSGWNLLGNPYPSALDWQSAYTASGANVDATVYVYNGTQWASWSTTGSVNGGSQYIAMGQGFFVNCSTPGTGTFMVDNADRVNNNVGYLKSEVSNKVSLQVEGNGYTDETAIIFNDDATAGFDSDFDAYKLMSDHPGVPSFYSMASTNLAVNVLPETNWVQLGFSAGVSGEFTISAIEINDIGIVVLEDTFTGEMTDLTSSSYTFDYTLNDNEQRFIIHFSPLSVGENTDKLFTVYSVNNEVVVVAPENTDGQINIYNMMGQEVVSTQINGTINTIALEKSAYYVVKVLSNNNMTTRKVFIK